MNYDDEVKIANIQSVINGYLIDIEKINVKIEKLKKDIDTINNKYIQEIVEEVVEDLRYSEEILIENA